MESSSRRVMVDLSATLLHHGHIRLLRAASELGSVVVALTMDDEIERTKGYVPELSFKERKEILEAVRYVDEVVPSPWLIDEKFLDDHGVDVLVHGHDNRNPVRRERLEIRERTEGISSTILRARVLRALAETMESKD